MDLHSPEAQNELRARRQAVLQKALPACQPQEGSPSNTFTSTEGKQLMDAYLSLQDLNLVGYAPNHKINSTSTNKRPAADQIDILRGPWAGPSEEKTCSDEEKNTDIPSSLVFVAPSYTIPRTFREDVRSGQFRQSTNGICPGYLQCNLVVLPAGKLAFDFLLFCQRNSKACPLLEVCEGTNTSYVPQTLASGADLRTDIPKYAIYRDGVCTEEVTDCSEYWPENAVAFLIGCSFSYDGALLNAGIPLKSTDAGKNVPMYKTNIACEKAGSLRGNMVVSMKPIPCTMVAKHVEITSKYTHAHGGPVCVGGPSAIGIEDMNAPEWGDPIDVGADEVPVFHACGVTPQAILTESRVPFAITHSAGHMFVTDQPSDMGIL